MSSLSINTNLNALTAQRHLSNAQEGMNQRLRKVASGLRVNEAADDAAGLAISEGMRAQMRGTTQSVQNLQDGLSMLQTAEGGISSIQGNLQRMRELSLQAANDTVGQEGREAIQSEIDQIVEEIDRSTETVQFNNQQLLNGDVSESEGGAELHAGADRDETINVSISNMDSQALGVDSIDVTSQEGAEQAVETLTTAVNQVSTERANVGAAQNRLEETVGFLQIQNENTMASESQIRDADMASETTQLAQDRIMTQAGTSMLGQARNLQGSTATQLLG